MEQPFSLGKKTASTVFDETKIFLEIFSFYLEVQTNM